jgi:hypothetical protein
MYWFYMPRIPYLALLISVIAISAVLFFYKMQTVKTSAANSNLTGFPSIILWAWERPEDLRFLDSDKFAVAFLAQTLKLKDDEVYLQARRQELKISPETRLIAVTRIETVKNNALPPDLSKTQSDECVQLILNTLKLKNVAAIQIDFDAKVSERRFYQTLLKELRNRLPNETPLSMTSLASFCIGDPWIKDLPVNEAIPMAFRMGADAKLVKKFLANGNDFPVALCRKSIGIATDESLTLNFGKSRRIYVFKASPKGWTRADVEKLGF